MSIQSDRKRVKKNRRRQDFVRTKNIIKNRASFLQLQHKTVLKHLYDKDDNQIFTVKDLGGIKTWTPKVEPSKLRQIMKRIARPEREASHHYKFSKKHRLKKGYKKEDVPAGYIVTSKRYLLQTDAKT